MFDSPTRLYKQEVGKDEGKDRKKALKKKQRLYLISTFLVLLTSKQLSFFFSLDMINIFKRQESVRGIRGKTQIHSRFLKEMKGIQTCGLIT